MSLTTAEIRHLIAKRYCDPEYATLFEVRNQTGFNRGAVRYADAISMSLWPSRGLHIHGFEIKVSRNDWVKELKNPAKAEEISAFCNFWWVVAPKGMIQDWELPQAWGLIEATKGGLKVKVKAPEQEATPVNATFLASLLRSASKASPMKAQIDAAVKDEIEGQIKSATYDRDRQIDRLRNEVESLKRQMSDFEESSGVHINRWNAGRVGEAVKFILNGGLSGVGEALERVVGQTETILSRAKAAQEFLKEEIDGREKEDSGCPAANG